MALVDSAAVVALYEIPKANGGYLDLAVSIVTQTIANVRAAGGSTGIAQAQLDAANAAIAASDFKGGYALLRRAYKAAGK